MKTFTLKADNQFKPSILDIISLYGLSGKDDSEGTISFKATSMIPLGTFLKNHRGVLNYATTLVLVYHLKLLIELLERSNKTLRYLSMDDIQVVNNEVFLFTGYDQIVSGEVFEIVEPIDKKNPKLFLSPELEDIKKLPTKITFRSVYFSVGMLVVKCILGEKINKKQRFFMKDTLGMILDTRLYWFISHSLEEDPEKRTLLFI